jgi:hypothetical protein
VYVPIALFLRGQDFEPETIAAMSGAFRDACMALGLIDRTDQKTALVAKHIIKLAERGIRTKAALYFMTVAEFKANSQ